MYKEGVNGRFIEVTENDPTNTAGVHYYVYIPNDVSASTKMHVYLPGENGDSKWNVRDSLLSDGCDSIVVFPMHGNYNTGNYSSRFLRVLDNVAEVYGGDNQHVSVSGVSTGGRQSIYAAVSSTSGEYKSKITSCAYMDSTQTSTISDSELKKMVDSGITLYMASDDEAVVGSEAAIRYAKLGGTVVVTDYGEGMTYGHNEKCDEPFRNNVIDWLNGNGDYGDKDKRRFFTYDSSGNKIEISYEEATKLIGSEYIATVGDTDIANNYDFGLLNAGLTDIKNRTQNISSMLNNSQLIYDNNFLYTNVNDIVNCVNGTLFLGGINNNGYNSTVGSLPQEDSLIGNYFSISTELLDSVIFEMENCLAAGEVVDDLNNNLQEETDKIDNVTNVDTSENTGGVGNTGGAVSGGVTSGNTTEVPSGGSTSGIASSTTGGTTGSTNTGGNSYVSKEENSSTPSGSGSSATVGTDNTTVGENEEISSPTDNTVNSTVTPDTSLDEDKQMDSGNSTVITPNDETVKDTTTSNDVIVDKSNTDSSLDSDNVTNQPDSSATTPTPSTPDEVNKVTSNDNSKSGVNPVGIAIGAAALGGAAYAGKKIHDKRIDADSFDEDDENVSNNSDNSDIDIKYE